jgi:hypothetical protein
MDATHTARALWEKLQLEPGLEIRLKIGRNGRDADFEDSAIATLVSLGLTTTAGKPR